MNKLLLHKELKDLHLLFDLIEKSPELKREEFGDKQLKMDDLIKWIESYSYLKGEWRVWEENKNLLGVTFHVKKAKSNNKPWLGAIIINPIYRNKGYAKKVIVELGKEIKQNGQSVLFAGSSFTKNQWGIFLGKCGFEQIGVQKNEEGKEYTVFGKLLE